MTARQLLCLSLLIILWLIVALVAVIDHVERRRAARTFRTPAPNWPIRVAGVRVQVTACPDCCGNRPDRAGPGCNRCGWFGILIVHRRCGHLLERTPA